MKVARTVLNGESGRNVANLQNNTHYQSVILNRKHYLCNV